MPSDDGAPKMKSFAFIAVAIAFGLAACGGAGETASHDHSGHHDAHHGAKGESSAPSKDMKALFGDDYQPGDIGHAFGEIVSIAPDGPFLTIDHGPIHGIGMGAMTMEFDVLSDVDVSGIDAGDKVEFLVKKSDAGTYDVMAICDLQSEEAKCLDRVLEK